MTMTRELFGYMIKYAKAWKAKQRAWKIIYGDGEEGYEKLPALFNALKAKNSCMHYEYIPKPNKWRNDREMFFRAFWCFLQCVETFRHCRLVLSINDTFLFSKYKGTLLVVISCDTSNTLVPLAFALVERENGDSWSWFLGDSWSWFLGLVRIHVVDVLAICSDPCRGPWSVFELQDYVCVARIASFLPQHAESGIAHCNPYDPLCSTRSQRFPIVTSI
jgi:hypothetical protein